jgi:Dyp-type peroxidase family
MLERGDIQGLVLSGYASSPRARCFLLRFAGGGGGAKPWLSRIFPRVTTGTRGERSARVRVNVGLSATGLRALGLPEASLATFPREFVQGMADPERSLVLGDVGAQAPEHWEFGGNERTRVDAALLTYAADDAELDELSAELEEDFERFGIEASEEDSYLPADRHEHFGFRDGISNVRLAGGLRFRNDNPFDLRVPPGEFVLGHLNAYGRFPESPRAPIRQGTRRMPRFTDARRAMELGENGSFLVLRKLAQDVAGFRGYVSREGNAVFPDDPRAAERFASLLVGRAQDGTPLARDPALGRGSEPNRFGYRDGEALTTRCPLGAHVRRANPRDGLGEDPAESLAHVRAHRLVRRGRLYGERLAPGAADDRQARGILFLALCANLRRQFEFVQETWLNGPKFSGLTHERDPLVGSGPPLASGERGETFSLQGEGMRRSCSLERFVTMRGGAYLFLPGLRGLAYLAEP